MKVIRVTIAKDASVEIEPMGYDGPGCIEATAELESALGPGDITRNARTLKAEFHNQPAPKVKQ